MLDIDNFKQSTTPTATSGRHVLREVAQVLRQSSREVDEPARYGGEEIAVALPVTDLEGAYHLAERVRGGIEALDPPLPTPTGAEGHRLVRRASRATAGAGDQGSLVAAGDVALYEAKRSGKNRTGAVVLLLPASAVFTASLPGSSLSADGIARRRHPRAPGVKRGRGADPAEVESQEHEALAPGSRPSSRPRPGPTLVSQRPEPAEAVEADPGR